MSNFQLRQFHFFTRESLDNLPEAFTRPELLFASNEGDLIFTADSHGSIHIVSRSFITRSFVAVSGDASVAAGTCITQILHLPQIRTLLTIEENVSAANSRPTIKLWPVDRLLRTTDIVEPVVVKYQQPSGSNVYPLTAVATTPSLSQIGLGFAGGQVVLIRGNIAKNRSVKQKTLYKAPEPITNLHFVTNESNTITLYATTTGQTLAFDTSLNGKSTSPIVLEERGCGIGCSLVNDEEQLIVARDEAIYFYTTDGRGPCFAFDAPKVMLRRFKHYLLLATAAPSTMAPTLENRPIPSEDDNDAGIGNEDTPVYPYNDATTFIILDTKNKLVAYTGVVPGGVRGMAVEWGSVFVLGGHGTLDHFSEKDLLKRLDILYRQNLYPLAVKMAQNGSYDLPSVAGIYKRYGDWLYAKDDFDMAMAQYMQTIGYVEPSYIIRKYLDAQRLVNLAGYVQQLHTEGMATSDHTTLLLNCYTKLRDEERLNQFIHTPEDYQFDVDTAIHVCRQAGFYDQALYLADKFNKTGMYLKLKIEDQGDIQAALDYMHKLDDKEISTYLTEFGRRCLATLPRETTKLLVNVCIREMDARDSSSLSLRKIQHLFADQPTWLVVFLESVIDRRWSENQGDDDSVAKEENDDMKLAWNTLLELYLCGVESSENDGVKEKRTPKERALEVLHQSQGRMVDWDRAYFLCASNDFTEGIAVLYELKGDIGALFDLYIVQDDVKSMQELLDKHGEQQPDLYVKALHYFAGNPQLADSERLLKECLDTIEKYNIMAPLRVLQALGGSDKSGVTLGVVRSYIMRQIEATNKRIQDNKKTINSYSKQHQKYRQEMDDLKNKPVVFQSTKCSSCMAPLDLPSIHFMCKHSYHHRCLGDVGDICPKCQAENQMLEDQRHRREVNARQHDAFFDKLQKAEDGFSVISETFAKSPFAFTRLVDQ